MFWAFMCVFSYVVFFCFYEMTTQPNPNLRWHIYSTQALPRVCGTSMRCLCERTSPYIVIGGSALLIVRAREVVGCSGNICTHVSLEAPCLKVKGCQGCGRREALRFSKLPRRPAFLDRSLPVTQRRLRVEESTPCPLILQCLRQNRAKKLENNN